MELIIYDQPGRSISTTPQISFNNTGGVTFNRPMVEFLGLKAGEHVAFAQDPNDPVNWYVYKASTGFKTRASKANNLVFNAAEICKRILDGKKVDRPAAQKSWTVRLKIGKEPIDYQGHKLYPIITAPLAQKANEKRLEAMIQESNGRRANKAS